MQTDVFLEAEKNNGPKKKLVSRASWRGTLSMNVPELGLGVVQYHLRAAKVHGDQVTVVVRKVDGESGKEVISRDVPKMYSYRLGPNGERLDVKEIPFEDVKDKVCYENQDLVFAKTERSFFRKDELEINGKWIEVPPDHVVDKQDDGEMIEPFDRTTDIDVSETGYVSMERVPEYRFKEVYQLAPDSDKKVRESGSRVTKLARHLMEKQIALVAFFSWGRGYQYYTAVVYPYERKKDGKLWLLMGMSEGILQLEGMWSLEEEGSKKALEPVPTITVRQKPKVTISK
jgi:hypothetical protein